MKIISLLRTELKIKFKKRQFLMKRIQLQINFCVVFIIRNLIKSFKYYQGDIDLFITIYLLFKIIIYIFKFALNF
jgi:hypothetical protein